MNKTAVITGGGTGIGRAISLKLAEDGFNIAVNCLESLLPQAQAVAEECRARGVEAECFVADVSKFDACAEMVKAVQERFGSVDVLVNNAGVGSLVRTNILDVTEESLDRVFGINLKGYLFLGQLAAILLLVQSIKTLRLHYGLPWGKS